MGWLKGKENDNNSQISSSDPAQNLSSRIATLGLDELTPNFDKLSNEVSVPEILFIESNIVIETGIQYTASVIETSASAHHTNDQAKEKLWIVIDETVYDCSNFVHEHPGGETVIQSFAGKDCSWQFWRFHNKSILENVGAPLRIGRTKGVSNPYVEPKRFIGLRRLGDDDWNW